MLYIQTLQISKLSFAFALVKIPHFPQFFCNWLPTSTVTSLPYSSADYTLRPCLNPRGSRESAGGKIHTPIYYTYDTQNPQAAPLLPTPQHPPSRKPNSWSFLKPFIVLYKCTPLQMLFILPKCRLSPLSSSSRIGPGVLSPVICPLALLTFPLQNFIQTLYTFPLRY